MLLYFEKEENGGLSLALQIAIAKDPDAKFFKKLDGFQACEVNELKAGTHVFAVYDLQVLARFTEMTNKYAQEMQAVSSRLDTAEPSAKPQFIDGLLKERNTIHASYTTISPLKRNSSSSKISSPFNGSKSDEESPTIEKKPKDEKKSRDRTRRKKWFKIHLKVDKRKAC
ncbi:hypothetical protein BHE74_00026461 [Ensete ventricosum]|nr:hypothetical protein BHE74_00026461 [Ensete ventricosum]